MLAETGISALRMLPVAERAGVAVGTVYRYFPAKTDLLAAVVTALAAEDEAAMEQAAAAAPGPLSALVACVATLATRAITRRRLTLALTAQVRERELAELLISYRQSIAAQLEKRLGAAVAAGVLQQQDAVRAAPAMMGALIEGLIGPLAASAPADDPAVMRAETQRLTLFALRALGINDARARGLVLQTKIEL
jgi:AcrR family transcriptional regulator